MKILSLSVTEILGLTKQLDNDVLQIKDNLIKMCWHMRGALSFEEAWALGVEERDIIQNLVKENLETTKKTGIPYF